MLFAVQKLADVIPLEGAAGLPDEGEQLLAPSPQLQDVINLVDHGATVHWLSNGHWSMHQLLVALLDKTGPCDVWISSYAFSELPARTLCDLKASGAIKRLVCIIDSRVDIRSASALAMMKNNADVLKLCATHAKVTVLKNDQWFLSVVGSANYTQNKRYEAGMISADAGVSSFHKNWIDNELSTLE